MNFYRCTNCGLLTNDIFKHCPSCGTDSPKEKEIYVRTLLDKKEIEIIKNEMGE